MHQMLRSIASLEISMIILNATLDHLVLSNVMVIVDRTCLQSTLRIPFLPKKTCITKRKIPKNER